MNNSIQESDATCDSTQQQTDSGAIDAAMQLLSTLVEEEKMRHTKRLRFLRGLRKRAADINRCVDRFGGRLSQWDDETLYWVIDVDSFAAALPIIELAESFFGECRGSQDWPEYRQRDFLFNGLRIAYTLKNDSDACRVVVKGFEHTPIFEFVCGEARA